MRFYLPQIANLREDALIGGEMQADVGDLFQRETKYMRGQLPRGTLDWANKPAPYKTYPEAPQILLGPPELEGGLPLWTTLQMRRSLRQFEGTGLTLAELGQLLWAAQGVSHIEGTWAFRTAPSAGALYPLEIYPIVHLVEGLQPGVYHYAVVPHTLEQLRLGDFRSAVAHAALDQRLAHDADVVLVWTAIFERSKWKYKQRAYRYIYLDAGHAAQNLALAATALGLGSCALGALYDDEANTLLGLEDEQESVIYMSAVGRI